MPQFVDDQRAVFNSNDFFRRLSKEAEVRYIGCRDLPIEERRHKFLNTCKNGRAEIAFISSGINFVLQFFPWNINSVQGMTPPKDCVNFEQEPGKVFLKAPFVLNGVCVCWRGWISLVHLDGMGCIEFDEERAVQQPSTSGLQLNKITGHKMQAVKHHATLEHPCQVNKRPRLC